MDIYTINQDLNITGIISQFESVIWNMQYFGKSDMELVVSATQKNLDLLQPGTFLIRDMDITQNNLNNIMVIEGRTIAEKEDKGYTLTIKGKGLKNILSRRIVWSQLNYENETVENIIRDVITKNCINPDNTERKIDNLILAPSNGYTETATIQLFSENIGEWLESICTQYGYGWDIRISEGKLIFYIYKGKDRTYNSDDPVIFAPSYDNLYSSVYNNQLENYANVALVGGEGEGTEKKTADIGTATGLDRYEGYIDGSSVSSNEGLITEQQYIDMLKAYGEEHIKEYQVKETLEGTINPYGMYKLNQDYFLGDIVQVTNEKGIISTPRITEIIYSEDANGIKIVPTFTEWEVN